MGQGQEVNTKPEPLVEIQERGEIFFFYRPKVDKEEVHSADDVQRLYIIMWPESGERPVEEKQDPDSGEEGKKKGSRSGESGSGTSGTEGGHGSQEVNIEKQPLFRFMVIGKKRLPDPSKKGEPYWGFVEMVTTNIDDVKNALKEEEYDTSTRGRRRRPPARALGEGIYRNVRHKAAGRRTHTHLVYKLEFPQEENEPQESFNIGREGSFVIQIKNPEQHDGSQSRGVQNKRKATFPAHLQARLGQRRFCPADPPDFLNYEGCEFLLISASDNIEEELGLELEPEAECSDPSRSDLVKTFGDSASIRPLLEGTWD